MQHSTTLLKTTKSPFLLFFVVIVIINIIVSSSVVALTFVLRRVVPSTDKHHLTSMSKTMMSSSRLQSSSSSSSSSTSSTFAFADIGANLLDERFTEGMYYGKQRHESDMDQVLLRAEQAGVKQIIITAGTLQESQRAVQLVRNIRKQQQQQQQQYPMIHLGCTVGVHPTRCYEEFVQNVDDDDDDVSADDLLDRLKAVAIDGQIDQSVVALGEMGLDYDRLQFCDKETQQYYLRKQLETFASAPELENVPFFLHNRNVGRDLLEILKEQPQKLRGVIHSFDDTLELAQEFIDFGFYIGLNGCSLRTEDNIKVAKALPMDKILLETDCPYCEIKATHAGSDFVVTKWDKKVDKKFEYGKMVKGRNEPCQIVQVAEVLANVKEISLQYLSDVCYQNTQTLYYGD